MKRSIGTARVKFVNGAIFVVLGLIVVGEFVRSMGFRIEALSGYLLGSAMIALGILRLRAGWPRP